jgi:hypothetical protein
VDSGGAGDEHALPGPHTRGLDQRLPGGEGRVRPSSRWCRRRR